MIKREARPLSRKNIRGLAWNFRKLLGVDNQLYVDVLRILELILYQAGVEYEIVAKEEMREEAVTYPDENKIFIREDVYKGAKEGKGRYRYTIMHEIAHLLLHEKCQISFARGEADIPLYKNPEWQADVFAAEFLMPKHMVEGMSIQEVVEKCKVSKKAAEVQLSVYKKENR